MLTIYSAVQRTHRPAYVVKQGERSPSFDAPERVDSILSAVREIDDPIGTFHLSVAKICGGDLWTVTAGA